MSVRALRPTAREARSLARPYRIALVASLVGAVLLGTALPATASPLTQTQQQAAATRARIDALDAKLAATTRSYGVASERVARLQRATARNSVKLDVLLATLNTLQGRLDTRAADMYRSGPYAFVEVLAGTTSFDEFVTTWDLLTELSLS